MLKSSGFKIESEAEFEAKAVKVRRSLAVKSL